MPKKRKSPCLSSPKSYQKWIAKRAQQEKKAQRSSEQTDIFEAIEEKNLDDEDKKIFNDLIKNS